MSCIFCEIDDYILDNELVYAIFDRMPVNKGHMLFITKRHAESFFDITKEEREAIFNLIDEALSLCLTRYTRLRATTSE